MGSSEEENLREGAERRNRRRGEGRKERSGRRKRATAEPGPMRIIAASGGRAAEAPRTVIGREEENRTDKTSGGRSVGIRLPLYRFGLPLLPLTLSHSPVFAPQCTFPSGLFLSSSQPPCFCTHSTRQSPEIILNTTGCYQYRLFLLYLALSDHGRTRLRGRSP